MGDGKEQMAGSSLYDCVAPKPPTQVTKGQSIWRERDPVDFPLVNSID